MLEVALVILLELLNFALVIVIHPLIAFHHAQASREFEFFLLNRC